MVFWVFLFVSYDAAPNCVLHFYCEQIVLLCVIGIMAAERGMLFAGEVCKYLRVSAGIWSEEKYIHIHHKRSKLIKV